MKFTYIILSIALMLSTIGASLEAITPIRNIDKHKHALKRNITSFFDCIKGNNNCTPQNKKIVRTALTIIGVLGLLAAGGIATYALTRKNFPMLPNKLSNAILLGNFKEAKELINADSELIHARNAHGETPLQIAIPEYEKISNANIDFITHLIKSGAYINAQDNKGTTALMKEIDKSDNIEFIQYLISQGADINLKNKKGKTALDIAQAQLHNWSAPQWADKGIKENFQRSIAILQKQRNKG